MRQRRTFYNDKRVSSSGRDNNYKYMHIHTHVCIRALKYRKQTLTELKGETDSNIVTIGYSNTPLSVMDRTKRRSVKKTEDLTLQNN